MALATTTVEKLFGKLRWKAGKTKGAIVILDNWEEQNIVSLPNVWGIVTPLVKPAVIRCHSRVARKIQAALNDLAGQGLIHLVQTFDGCFVPRHKCWDPRRTLSRHSWGIAVDLNARWCPYGSNARQPAKVISAFTCHGFEWGGAWKTPDPMHFEAVSAS